MKKILLSMLVFPFLAVACCNGYLDEWKCCTEEYTPYDWLHDSECLGMALDFDRLIILTKEQRVNIGHKINEHKIAGYKALMAADAKAWYIPDMHIRDITREAIKGAIATVGRAGCKGCVVAAIINVCAAAGAKVYDQYIEAQTAMFESQHHFEMVDFLEEVLRRDGVV